MEKKRIAALLMVLSMVLTLCACGKSAADSSESASSDSDSQEAASLNYPTQDITVIIPFDAGGNADLSMRALINAANDGGYSLLSTCFWHQPISRIMEPIQPANTASMIQSIIKVPSSPLFWRESYHINREGALNISGQGLKAYKGPPKQKAARKSGRLWNAESIDGSSCNQRQCGSEYTWGQMGHVQSFCAGWP